MSYLQINTEICTIGHQTCSLKRIRPLTASILSAFNQAITELDYEAAFRLLQNLENYINTQPSQSQLDFEDEVEMLVSSHQLLWAVKRNVEAKLHLPEREKAIA